MPREVAKEIFEAIRSIGKTLPSAGIGVLIELHKLFVWTPSCLSRSWEAIAGGLCAAFTYQDACLCVVVKGKVGLW